MGSRRRRFGARAKAQRETSGTIEVEATAEAEARTGADAGGAPEGAATLQDGVTGAGASAGATFACSVAARLRGLLGLKTHEGILVLAPCGDVHTHGMRAPLDIAFADKEGRILSSWRNVPPKHRLRQRGAVVTLERFARPDAPWPKPGSSLSLNWEERTLI